MSRIPSIWPRAEFMQHRRLRLDADDSGGLRQAKDPRLMRDGANETRSVSGLSRNFAALDIKATVTTDLEERLSNLRMSPRRRESVVQPASYEEKFAQAFRSWRNSELANLTRRARLALDGETPPSSRDVARSIAKRIVLFELGKLKSPKIRRWIAARALVDLYGFGKDWLVSPLRNIWAALLAGVDETLMREALRLPGIDDLLQRRLLPIALYVKRRLGDISDAP